MATRDEAMAGVGRMLQDEAAAANRWRVVPPQEMGEDARERLVFEAGIAIDAPSAEDAAPLIYRYRNGSTVGVDAAPGRKFWVRRAELFRGDVEPRPLPPRPEPNRSGMSKDRRSDTGLCRKCGAKLLWAKTAASGKAIPLDPEPPDGVLGNVLVDGTGRAVVFGSHDAAKKARADDIASGGAKGIVGEPTTSHFAKCHGVTAARETADAKKKAERMGKLGGEQMGLEL